MRNLSLFKLTAVLVSLILAPHGFALPSRGGMEGGGGKGVLCGTSLRTLEVYEAEEIYHLPSVPKYPKLDENLVTYGSPLLVYWSHTAADINDPALRQAALGYAYGLIRHFKDIPSGTTLPLTDDATLPTLPSDCSFVQIAIYSDPNNEISRDPILWNMLSPYDQAALIWHELYYHSARQVHATTSDDTRRMIGLAMFNQLPAPRLKPFWGSSSYLECIATDQQGDVIYMFRGRDEVRNGTSGVALYADISEGKLFNFRTTTFLPGVSIGAFASPMKESWTADILNEFTGEIGNFELHISDTHLGTAEMRSWSAGVPAPGLSSGGCFLMH